jgi:drug/metabolite transporter (DMT)-like permease
MTTGLLYAFGAAITWGFVYTIDQKILMNVSPLPLLFIDAVITLIIMLPFAVYQRAEIRAALSSGWNNVGLMVLAVALAVIASYLIYCGIQLLGAPTASVIEIAYPFFVVLFTLIFFRTAPSMYVYIGGLLIFSGAALITYFQK